MSPPVLPTIPNPAGLNPEQLRTFAEQIRELTREQVAALPPDQVGFAAQILEKARWAGESHYFGWLHSVLPEPFFQTQGFVIFFLTVATAYWLLPRRWNTARVYLLVIASFHFYAAWNASLAFLVTITATFDYLLARWMDSVEHRGRRRVLMWISILMNLGVLAYFKYRGFFLNELHDLVAWLGGTPGFTALSPLNILIPFGISFYTFEAISYAVDVFQRKVKAERSLPHFMLFILFFPHLVAGPIVRAGDFLRQAHRVKRWNWVRVQVGVQLVLLGLFKKLAIADRMAMFCDGIAHDGPLVQPQNYTSSAVWLAVLAYALRIYADFSGYSDMAVGTAHLLGFKLTQNFNMPYLSRNVSEFWRRWHISLSTWLRDYVFFSITSLHKRGVVLMYVGLIVTMLLGGIWHGAAWTFVIWGLLHGAGLAVVRGFAMLRKRFGWQMPNSFWSSIGAVFVTFHFVCVTWIFFRADSFSQAFAVFRSLGTFTTNTENLPLPILLIIALTFAAQWLPDNWWRRMQRSFAWLPAPAQAVLLAGLAMGLYLIASSDVVPFIYARF